MSKSADKSIEPVEELDLTPVRIDPEGFYRPAQIIAMFSERFLNHLRDAGLCAVAGWYLGKAILESFEHAWQNKKCQRGSAGKEENDDAEHAEKAEEMGEDSNQQCQTIQPVPQLENPRDLRGQLEEIEGLRKKAV